MPLKDYNPELRSEMYRRFSAIKTNSGMFLLNHTKPINSRRPMLDYISNLIRGCAKSNNTIESTGRLSRINHTFPWIVFSLN
jgi:hypothetical protein